MTIDQLEAIAAVVKTGSFRSAAKRLKRTQSALSVSIKKLESDLKIVIFDRSSYRPTLTKAGEVFVQKMGTVLDDVCDLKQLAVTLGDMKMEPSLTVALDPNASDEDIQLIVSTCHKLSPNTQLTLEYALGSSMNTAINSGSADLAILPFLILPTEVEHIQLESNTFVTVVARSAFKSHQSDPKMIINRLPEVLLFLNSKNTGEETETSNHECTNYPTLRKTFVNEHALKERLIAQGLGWGRIFVRDFEKYPRGTLIELKSEPRIPLQLALAKKKGRTLGPLGRAMWGEFRKRKAPKEKLVRTRGFKSWVSTSPEQISPHPT